MKKVKNSAFHLCALSFLGLGVLVSCSHHSQSTQDVSNSKSAFLPGPEYAPLVTGLNRSPAAQAVPYAPGTPTRPGTQPAPAPAPTKPGTPPATPPGAGHGSAPTHPTTPPSEAAGGCPAPLNRIAVGGYNPMNYNQPYSVMDVLMASNQGRTITGSTAGDRALLAPWFRVQLEPGSEIFSAIEHSKPWCRAVEFISGVFSTRCGEMKAQDALINPRMAAVMVSVLAVRNQPECVREVRSLGQKVLGANIAEVDEAIIPLTEAATDLKSGHLMEKFQVTDKARDDLEAQIKKVDAEISVRENQSREVMEEARKELSKTMSELKLALAKIPACSATVKFHLSTMDGTTKADAATNTLVDDCKIVLKKKLEDFQSDEAELTALVAKYAEKHELNPGLVVTEEERRVKDKLEVKGRQVKLYQGYLDLLENKEDVTSIYSKKQKIDALMKTGTAAATAIQTKSYAPEQMKIKADLEAKYNATSSRYLTYGFFGGFGNLPTR